MGRLARMHGSQVKFPSSFPHCLVMYTSLVIKVILLLFFHSYFYVNNIAQPSFFCSRSENGINIKYNI